MILVLSGTGDGRKITQSLTRLGFRVGVVATTGYGQELARDDGAEPIELEFAAITDDWLKQMNVMAVVNASHPFTRTEENALAGHCEALNIIYLRVGREETNLATSELIYPVQSMEEAAQLAATLGKTIFLTTGSHDLEHFTTLKQQMGLRLVVRILPEHRIVKKCQDMGIAPRDIIAMHGPFSKAVNKTLLKMYKASVIVTKDSGKAGGTDTKIEAALSLKIPVVVVKRPKPEAVKEYNWEEVINILQSQLK